MNWKLGIFCVAGADSFLACKYYLIHFLSAQNDKIS